MQLKSSVLKNYAASRSGTLKSVVCHAPLVSLNFEQNGNARACCYNFKHVLGTWPKNSIKEIWNGKEANVLRAYIKENNLGDGCSECGKMIEVGNHQGVRARYYDEYMPNDINSRINYLRNSLTGYLPYPKVIEFELSNECNLECVMCNGYFSSSIRKNREKLPPTNSPYNDNFVDELEAFIPHLTDAKFLGGEPFMIDIYLKIWERILKINPSIRIHITTNGTFLNNRIKDLLDGLKAGIILSTDSVNQDTYSKIRVNGNFNKVMENLEFFRDYTKRKKTFISIAACPIIHNWHELPEMLEFCLEKNIALYFNAVFTPQELSLREQPLEFLANVIQTLERYKIPTRSGTQNNPANLSINAYEDFIKQLKGWYKQRLTETEQHKAAVSNVVSNDTTVLPSNNLSIAEIELRLKQLMQLNQTGLFDKEKEVHQELAQLILAVPNDMLTNVLECYLICHLLYNNSAMQEAVRKQKADDFAAVINSSALREKILTQMAQLPPNLLGGFIISKTVEELKQDINTYFI